MDVLFHNSEICGVHIVFQSTNIEESEMINSSVSSNSIDESQSGSSLSEIDPVDEILINAFETPVPKVSLENFALIRVLGRGG